jgi:hypothetical protein
MRVVLCLATLLVLGAGCTHPAVTTPTTLPTRSEVVAGPRRTPLEGDLTVTIQFTAHVCPLQPGFLGHSKGATVHVENATGLDLRFAWKPVDPIFVNAIFGMTGKGGEFKQYVQGQSALNWHLDHELLAGHDEVGISLVGPVCGPEEGPFPRVAQNYTQTAHFWGNVTFPM